MRCVSAVFIACFIAVSAQLAAAQLSLADIDLLVGTPIGVKEPLDERRSKTNEPTKLDFSEFIEIPKEEIEFSAEQWAEDANEAQNSASTEAQYLDMLCEAETFEGYNDDNIAKAEAEAEAETETETETETEPETAAEAETEPETAAEPEPEPAAI